MCTATYMYEQIWEKGPLRAEAEFLFLITHDLEAVLATGLKPGTATLQLLYYTRCTFRALPTSSLGVVITSQISQNQLFYISHWSPTVLR